MTSSRTATLIAVFAITIAACGKDEDPAFGAMNETSGAESNAVATADLEPTRGNDVSGEARFRDLGEGQVEVELELTGLEPMSTHAFHIHEFGDCSAPDASSAGNHFNPTGEPHGLPPVPNRHAGDLGNLTADAEGTAVVRRTYNTLPLGGTRAVIGKAIIVHESADRGVQPSGGSGDRIACGVIIEE
jgi:Cu-Zn family superoxide dismutase